MRNNTNKVKRAIILAAGLGTRLLPLTAKTPKPLLEVNKKVIIERMIEALNKNNINDIYIVVGYMKEKFEYLKSKYKNITLIENEFYDKSNNISSIYVSRNLIPESIILEGDLIIYNPQILTPFFEKSGYNCIYNDTEKAKEWGLKVENGRIIECNKSGGDASWQLYGISRWNKKDGEKLKEHVKIEFENNKNSQLYWDDIALDCYIKEYDLGIVEMNKNDVIEIDTYEELLKIDEGYKNT